MKKILKSTKGITRIVLVVIIAVLIILVGIIIRALWNWQNKNTENNNSEWIQNKTVVTNGTTTYTVGDDYSYECGVSGYTGGWKVLGAENGKLLIMSTIDIGTLELSGKEGYNTGISQLNTMCAKYGTNARSITVEDVNRVTGYNPTNQGDGTVYNKGNFREYGNKVTYTASGSSATNGQIYKEKIINYQHLDGRIIGKDNVDSITVESTRYYYHPYSLTDDDSTTGECKGIATDSPAYEMLFGTNENTSNNKGNEYWLASLCVDTHAYYSEFDMRVVYSDGFVNAYFLWDSFGDSHGFTFGVRAVVSI